MAARSRRWLLSCLVGAALTCAGCDFGALTYFLMPEGKHPPDLKKLASDDPKKTTRVVLLTYMPLETRFELVQADRQLAEMLAKQLREMCELNQQKVEVVSPRKVEEYKNDHPDWKARDLAEVGRHFRADYLVYLDISSLSLYEKGNMVFRGRANIDVSVIDVNNPDEDHEGKPYTCVYPSEAHGPVDLSIDTNEVQFRQAFLKHITRELCLYFVPYSNRDKYYNFE